MQTLSDIPEVVQCFPYNPQPKASGRLAPKVCQLVMELMEVHSRLNPCPNTYRRHSAGIRERCMPASRARRLLLEA